MERTDLVLALVAFVFITLWHQTREVTVFPSYSKKSPNNNTQDRNGDEDNDILNDAQQHRARTRRFNDTMQTLESLDLLIDKKSLLRCRV